MARDDTRETNGLDNTGSINGSFNSQENTLAHEVVQLSAENQQKCQIIREVGNDRLEAEKKSQQRSHKFRVLKAENALMQNYITQDAPRPEGDMRDPRADLKIITEQAERQVTEREAHYLDNIKRETEASIRQVIGQERTDASPSQDHDHDMER